MHICIVPENHRKGYIFIGTQSRGSVCGIPNPSAFVFLHVFFFELGKNCGLHVTGFEYINLALMACVCAVVCSASEFRDAYRNHDSMLLNL